MENRKSTTTNAGREKERPVETLVDTFENIVFKTGKTIIKQ